MALLRFVRHGIGSGGIVLTSVISTIMSTVRSSVAPFTYERCFMAIFSTGRVTSCLAFTDISSAASTVLCVYCIELQRVEIFVENYVSYAFSFRSFVVLLYS